MSKDDEDNAWWMNDSRKVQNGLSENANSRSEKAESERGHPSIAQRARSCSPALAETHVTLRSVYNHSISRPHVATACMLPYLLSFSPPALRWHATGVLIPNGHRRPSESPPVTFRWPLHPFYALSQLYNAAKCVLENVWRVDPTRSSHAGMHLFKYSCPLNQH